MLFWAASGCWHLLRVWELLVGVLVPFDDVASKDMELGVVF